MGTGMDGTGRTATGPATRWPGPQVLLLDLAVPGQADGCSVDGSPASTAGVPAVPGVMVILRAWLPA